MPLTRNRRKRVAQRDNVRNFSTLWGLRPQNSDLVDDRYLNDPVISLAEEYPLVGEGENYEDWPEDDDDDDDDGISIDDAFSDEDDEIVPFQVVGAGVYDAETDEVEPACAHVLTTREKAAELGRGVTYVKDHAEELGGVKGERGQWFFPKGA